MAEETSREVPHFIAGVAYILPRFEGAPWKVRKIGSFAFGIGARWSSFGIGVDVLKAGALLMVGPFFLWIAHIDRQLAHYESIEAGRG